MHKLRRFFHQNKDKITKTLAFIFFIFLLIQMMNFFTKNNNWKQQINNSENNITIDNKESNKSLISNKSAVTSQEIAEKKLTTEVTVIDDFLSYCNEKNLERAYNLLTDECKKQMYTSVEYFQKAYYMNVFNGEKRIFTIENWYGNTYKVSINEDILATGKPSNYSKQDYITVKEVDGKYKLNINNYIGYYKINEITVKNDISVEVVSKNTYKEYEEYTIKVINKTENTIKLDDVDSAQTLYLEDKKGGKYYYYNHELTQPTITISPGQTKEVTIKFYSSYASTKEIEYMVFSNIIATHGQLSEKMEFRAKI